VQPNVEELIEESQLMTVIETRLIERLKQLPSMRVAEVADFVEFLAAREEHAAATERLGQAMGKLHALQHPPLSEEEVMAEIRAVRRERRRQAA
jgi:ferric-dicitrate binding protein FerR (iron transport regulator)